MAASCPGHPGPAARRPGSSAEHGTGAQVVPADRIDDAHERVLASDVRHRFVVDPATPR